MWFTPVMTILQLNCISSAPATHEAQSSRHPKQTWTTQNLPHLQQPSTTEPVSKQLHRTRTALLTRPQKSDS